MVQPDKNVPFLQVNHELRGAVESVNQPIANNVGDAIFKRAKLLRLNNNVLRQKEISRESIKENDYLLSKMDDLKAIVGVSVGMLAVTKKVRKRLFRIKLLANTSRALVILVTMISAYCLEALVSETFASIVKALLPKWGDIVVFSFIFVLEYFVLDRILEKVQTKSYWKLHEKVTYYYEKESTRVQEIIDMALVLLPRFET